MINSPAKSPPLAKQAFWLMFAKVVSFLLAFFLPLVLVRLMAQSEYGVYKQAFLLIATVQTTLPLSFGMTAFYFFPRIRSRAPALVVHILVYLGVMGLLAAFVLTLYPGLLARLFGSTELVPYAGLIGLIIFFRLFSSFLEVVATANEDVKYSTLFIILAQFTRTTFMGIAVVFAPSVQALLYASLFQGALQTAILLWYLQKRFPGFLTSFDPQLFREQFRYSLPIGLGIMIFNVEMDLHNYFVAHFFDSAAYAIYAVGSTQLPFITILRDSAGSILMSRVSDLQSRNHLHQIVVLVARAMRGLAVAYWPVYFFLLVCGRELIILLYGRNYEASWAVFAFSITLLPLNILVNEPVLRAFSDHRFALLKVRGLLLVLMVPGLYFGIRMYGMTGAIAVAVATALLEAVAISWKLIRILELRWEDARLWADVGKLAVASILACLPTAAVRHLLLEQPPFVILLVSGSVFTACYVALVLLMRIPQRSEIDQVIGGAKGLLRRLAPQS